MLKYIITLSLFVSLAAPKVVPVSPYPGKLDRWDTPEASVVDNTIYVFGGVEVPKLEPYIVNPDDDDDDDFQYVVSNSFDNKPTDIAHAYDIVRDQWRVETTTPFPFKRASSVAVGRDIFLFSAFTKRFYYGNHELWKYDTVRKNWSQKTSLPFLWGGSLYSCAINKKIYFTAGGGYKDRNIIHVYDVNSDEWEQPIFINKKLEISQMLCLDESLKVYANELNSTSVSMMRSSDMSTTYFDSGVFTVHYNGTALYSGASQEKRWGHVMASLDAYFYFYIAEDRVNEATVKRVNTRTSEYEVVATGLPYNFTNALFVPTNSNQVFLFGGGPMHQSFHHLSNKPDEPVAEDPVTEWSHKIVTEDQ